MLQPLDCARRFEKILLVAGGKKRQRGGTKSTRPARLFDVGGDGAQLVGEGRRLGDDLLELGDDVADQGLELGPAAGSTSSKVSISAIMNGSVCV